MDTGRFRGWILTINNPVDKSWDKLLDGFQGQGAVGQLEQGESGTVHWQLFLHYKNAVRFSTLKTAFPTAHIEPARSPQDAIKYCQKEDTRLEGPFTWGTLPMSQRESSIKANEVKKELTKERNAEIIRLGVKDACEAGLFPVEMALKVGANISYLKSLDADHTSTPNVVIGEWYHGKPRTGKSYRARQGGLNPDPTHRIYLKSLNKWWDAYEGEEVVVIEDVDVSHAPWLGGFLKIWADWHAFKAEIKGGQMLIGPFRKLIITSNYHPNQLWTEREMLDPILARFAITDFDQGRFV